MKYLIHLLFTVTIAAYNLPVIAVLALVSLYHDDRKYVSDYWDGLIGGLGDNFKIYKRL